MEENDKEEKLEERKKPFGAISRNLEPFGAIRSHVKPFMAI